MDPSYTRFMTSKAVAPCKQDTAMKIRFRCFWLCSVLLAVRVLCVAEHVNGCLFVKPDNNSIFNCPGILCLTLNQLAERNGSYFNYNSTIEFLAGNHSLQIVLHLSSVSNVTWRAFGNSSNVRIIFKRNATIMISNVRNLKIENIKFVLCKYQCEDPDASALQFDQYSQVSISNCEFLGTRHARMRSILAAHTNITITDCYFLRNTGLEYGGAIKAVSRSNISIANSVFAENRAYFAGGAIHLSLSNIIFVISNITFLSNEAQQGGAIYVTLLSKLSCNDNVTVEFSGNGAEDGGALYMESGTLQTVHCKMTFEDNTARDSGGAVFLQNYHITSTVLSGHFENNTAKCGGALYSKNVVNFTLQDATITGNSDSALCITYSSITFNNTEITTNKGEQGGGINSFNCMLSFKNRNWLADNRAKSGGAIYVVWGRVTLDRVVTFSNNSAEKDGGALYAIQTEIILPWRLEKKVVNFTLNSASNGGAIFLTSNAFFNLSDDTQFNFSFNRALSHGGGIYYTDSTVPSQCLYDENENRNFQASHCSIRLDYSNGDCTIEFYEICIYSYHNSAEKGGSFMYGGLLDRCRAGTGPDCKDPMTSFKYLEQFFHIDTTETAVITSQPYELCVCENSSNWNCTASSTRELYRGQTFTVSLVATAQGGNATNASVIAAISSNATLKLGQNPQTLPSKCSSLTYNVYSTSGSEVLTLYPEGPCHDTGRAKVVLALDLLDCPDGFALAPDGQCVCEPRLRDFNITCTIEEDVHMTKKAGAEFWMGASYNYDRDYVGLILYVQCPVEYCKQSEVNMTVHSLDAQCADNRVGLLCGQCADNSSLMIGSSRCSPCSSKYVMLLLAFAGAGIVLVAFLTLLRLTVATGMFNCLILYANIVQVNRNIFFPANIENILTVFVAWLNLDLGFETCFYSGMDAFAQTCLQFAFPLYVWLLISLIIFTSRYSITVSKLIGHNPVAVLATLILMSYTKILKIIIEVYSSVRLDFPNDRKVTVWLKDANVAYLQSKHLVLTIVTSLALVFIFLPYTLLLIMGQRLYRYAGRKYMRWMHKVKPLLDAYYAPYKKTTYYWTGLLLLVRCALYIVFSFNSLGGTQLSLFAIIITFTAIGFGVGFFYRGRIYRNLGVNILEAFVYLNLITLSAVSLAQVAHQVVLNYVLIGAVFFSLLGVIVYHFYIVYLAKCSVCLKLQGKIAGFFQKPKDGAEHAPSVAVLPTQDPHKAATKSVIDLREPLLEGNQ